MIWGNDSYKPSYLKLTESQLEERFEGLRKMAISCSLCPRNCGINRLQGERGFCGAGQTINISSHGPHFGEEKELVGRGGSGTIFFKYCNLECVFCQNWTISRAVERGRPVSEKDLALVMLELQSRGCGNINLVTPTHYIHQLINAISIAAREGLTIPLVYNSGGYESVESLRLLEGVIDIYMPDAQYGSDWIGKVYSGVPDYYSRFKESVREMQRQVGDLATDLDGLAYRGLLVRHLVLPDSLAGSEEVARFLSEEVSGKCSVNVMGQYYPSYRAAEFPALRRRLTAAELKEARKYFIDRGLRLL